MTTRTIMTSAALVGLMRASIWSQAPGHPITSEAEIREILRNRIDVQKQSVGIAVGISGPDGRGIITYGRLSQTDNRPVTGDSVFEIGSTTKVFTSLILADMVNRGELALTDPVAKLLPASVKIPERGGKQITLQDLATHTSGLPPMPSNFTPKDPTNPYADYTVAQLYAFLSSYQLTRNIGDIYEYSNLGVGLLGHALALRSGMDYESLVRTRIAGPFGMKDTAITLTPDMKARLATGHNAGMQPVANWDLPTLAGAGALRSTANDLLTFVSAFAELKESPLLPAMRLMFSVQRPTPMVGLRVALAWHLRARGADNPIAWHNGGTGGYRTFMGYDPSTKIAVVALSNASTTAGVDDIGMHILDSNFPLAAAAKTRTEIALDPSLLDRYVGTYRLAPTFAIDVRREGNRLVTQATNQPAFDLFAEDERNFFLKVVDAQLTFEFDAQGPAIAVVLHQNGRDQRASRVP